MKSKRQLTKSQSVARKLRNKKRSHRQLVGRWFALNKENEPTHCDVEHSENTLKETKLNENNHEQ